MNSYKKLFDNVVVLSLGTLGSKLIYFLLVPLYTYYLSQSEYGTVDLVTTTVAMLMPVVSACMYEAVLRYSVDKSQRTILIVNAIAISSIGFIIFLLFYPVLKYFNFLNDSLAYLYIILFIQLFNRIFAQYSRGVGQSRVFAISGIITASFTAIFNILFLVFFEWKIEGYFLSIILSYLLSTIYLILVLRPLKGTKLSDINFKITSTLLKYSGPLIPNYLMWWLINSSSRYFINWFVGLEANGLFGVASKIPSLISLVSEVFSQAWQVSAYESYEKKSDPTFYSKVFDFYAGILFVVSSIIFIFLKIAFQLLFSSEYFLAWQSVPFLILGSVFSALSGFIGVSYTASKETKGIFTTSIYGGIISFIINLILVPRIGVVGAGVSSMISFLTMLIIRYFDTKKLLVININWTKFWINILILLAQSLLLFLNLSLYVELLIGVIFLLSVIIINRNLFTVLPSLYKMIKSKFKI